MRIVSDASLIKVRSYRGEDASATLTVFVEAIAETAAVDYSPAQTSAWARPEQRTVVEWDRALQYRNSNLALLEAPIIGFSDVNSEGHIEMMFVTPRHSRRGGAPALLGHLHVYAHARGIRSLSADVSITAHAIFKKHRFTVTTTQTSHDRRHAQGKFSHDKGSRQRTLSVVTRARGCG